MGGYGSGQWRSRRLTVRAVPWLDIGRLRPALRSNTVTPSWTESWSRRGETIGTIGCTLLRESAGPVLQLNYTVTPHGGQPESVSHRVNLESTPCHYGGVRWWFSCPARRCEKRCRFLHLSGKHFVCRQCAGLTYESRQAHGDLGTESRLLKERLEALHSRLSRTRSRKQRDRLLRRAAKLEKRQDLAWKSIATMFGLSFPA